MNSTTPNWEKVKDIFSSALEVDAGDREGFVASLCGPDEALRGEVESWLASHAESDGFIETPAFTANNLFSNGASAVGRRFGNYTILNEIGEGGMGAVYLAKRADGQFEQNVALKIIRQSVADRNTIERFRRERQILATLNHPNIARLLDGGVSDAGEPFLAMEYVEGVSITEFADGTSLSLEARLHLFLKVCSAVAFAHRNLIVHRDIKPANILVTTDGEPKLLDFGLAKLIDDNLASDQEHTQAAFRALTPAYASPEQLKGETISTASDVYSLGIVLYELLTGERPFYFRGKSLDEIIRAVTAFEPAHPSRTRKTDPRLKGDLDNIVLTALRREAECRYGSVEHLADDIDKYLNGFPISARPTTFGYRASKFIKRHGIGVAAATVVILSIIAGIAGTIWQARQVQKQKEKAETINAFLEQTLKYSNPILSPLNKNSPETTVSEVLDEAARRLDRGDFDSDPEVKSELELTVAMTYSGQGKFLLSRKHLAEHVTILKKLYGENDPKYIVASTIWAALLFAKGDMAESEAAYREYLPRLRAEERQGRVAADVLADAVNNFAYLRRTQGDSREAESLFRESLDLMPQLSDEERRSVATTRSTLASTIADQGRLDEALQAASEAVREYRDRGDTVSPSYGFSLYVLGGLLAENGDYVSADSNFHEAESIFRSRLSPGSLWLADTLRGESVSLYGQQKYTDAVEKADQTLTMYEDNFGKHYDQYPTALIVKGLGLAKLGESAEGEKLLREAVEIRTASLPKEHFWVAMAIGALGECLAMKRRFEEAEPLLLESYESLRTSQGEQNPRTRLAQDRLTDLYRNWSKPDLAQQYNSVP